MTTITEFCHTLQHLLTTTANHLAKTTGFIQRERQISGAGFAQTLILGFLNNPQMTYKQCHHHAIQAGLKVSVQALDQRFNASAVDFMRALLEQFFTHIIDNSCANSLFPLCNGVYLTDCSRLAWHYEPLKLALRVDLQSGCLQASLTDILTHDQKADMIDRPLPKRALHIADLGFFKLKRFQSWCKDGVFWLSRYKIGTRLHTLDGQPIDLTHLLSTQECLSLPVTVGCGRNAFQATLLAQRMPEQALEKRKQRMDEQARLAQRPLSSRQLEFAPWTLYLTNMPDLSFEQAHILGRTRWQIELIFKLWKSHAQVLVSRSNNPIRQVCEGYAKLIGVIIAHWSLIVSGWHYNHASMVDAFHIFRLHVPHLQQALRGTCSLTCCLNALQQALVHAPRLQKRKNTPLTFQLWLDFHKPFP